MARANHGSVKDKREKGNVAVMGRPKKVQEVYQEPDPLPGMTVVDQPPMGVTVQPDVDNKPAKPESEAVVVAPPDEPEAPEYTYSFAVSPSIGHRWKVTATRNDGEEQDITLADKESAEKWVVIRVAQLAAIKAKKDQEKAEVEAKIAPIVTLNQVIELKSDNSADQNKPVMCLVGEPESSPSVAIETKIIPAPRFNGELVLPALSKDCPDLHVIPELSDLVRAWLGAESVQSFRPADEGLIILSHPSYRKALFFVVNGRPIMCKK